MSAHECDFVIIGGGIMGLTIALRIAEMGTHTVTLLEKSVVGAGSSGKSGAILRQHYSHRTTILMARDSLAWYRDFHQRTGRDIGFHRTGMIMIGEAGDRESLASNVALQQSLGVETEMLDTDSLRALEPRGHFPDGTVGALEHEAGYVDPVRTVRAISTAAQEFGADIREHVRVSGILRDKPGSAVRGVQIDGKDEILSPTVINAGGPWAGIICRELGINLPLEAIRPQQAFFAPPDEGEETYIFGDLVNGIYWKPEAAGWTRIGMLDFSTDETVPDPDNYDEGVDTEFVDLTRTRLAQRIPCYADAMSRGGGGALYTVTPDAHALIGPLPEPRGLFIVAGFSGHGFKLGPAVAKGVVGMLTDGDMGSFDPDFFRLNRFDEDDGLETSYRYGILG